MPQKAALSMLVLFFCLITVGCLGKSDQSAYVVNQAPLIDSESPLDDQSVELRNCDGKTEHNPLADQVQVACNITISNTASSSTTGNTIELTPELKTLLSEKVMQAYQQTFNEAKANIEQTDLAVPAGRIRTYKIYWTQKTISSTVSFIQEDQTYSVSYTYVLDIPKVTIAMETGCTA